MIKIIKCLRNVMSKIYNYGSCKHKACKLANSSTTNKFLVELVNQQLSLKGSFTFKSLKSRKTLMDLYIAFLTNEHVRIMF